MDEKNGGLFQEAKNEQGYLKANFLGFPGSGKTYTAACLAIGIFKMIKAEKPVYALDTEKGFDYLVKKFADEKVPLRVARTRAFTDLLTALDDAEANASVLIVDSVTHFWQEIQESFKREHKRTQLRLQDWGPLKSAWAAFPTKFLNNKLHVIVCGRAGDDMEYQLNDDTGKMEAFKSGTKMLAEKNLSYEPGLCVEMERFALGQLKKGQRNVVNRAHILKDRFNVIDGQSFDDPTIETFLPHIEQLNLGNHAPISASTSKEIFDKDSDKNWMEKRKQVEILKEEIQGELTSAYPGQTVEEKKIKTDITFEAFGTRSWVALDDKNPADLRKGLLVIKTIIAARGPLVRSKNGTKKEEVGS